MILSPLVKRSSWALFVVLLCSFQLLAQIPTGLSHDLLYVRAPRNGDDSFVDLPEVFHPIEIAAGTDLMLLHPDGSEEVLVAGGDGAVVDPMLSFDGLWCYYTKFHDQTNLDQQRPGDPSRAGADIYKINMQTRETVRLTSQEWTPNSGVVAWSSNNLSAESGKPYYLGYGVFNLGPCPLPGGKVIFSSSRNNYFPNKTFTHPNLQLFVMDNDGTNVECIGHLNLGSALHPTVLMDGRVMFSSYEAQGLRDQRLWGLWAIWPDGRKWEPLLSAFTKQNAFHFQTQMSNGHVAVADYYNSNNKGFGTILAFPASKDGSVPPFGNPRPGGVGNPSVRRGLWNLYLGHENHLKPRYPAYDSGLARIPGGVPVTDESQMHFIKNDPNWNEIQPRPVVTYEQIYGIPEPAYLPWYKNDGSDHPSLEPGTPFGLVGSSSFYHRDTEPAESSSGFDGMDAFNTNQNQKDSNWNWQGAAAGMYDESDIYAVRILAMEPTSNVGRGPGIGNNYIKGFYNHANERLRVLGEVPLRKTDAEGQPLLDPKGDPDTSFLARIPADTPFTFQTIDEDGLVLNMSQTWHQVRPGERRADCGGCHAHSKMPVDFDLTAAALPAYQIPDLALKTPLLSKDTGGNPVVVESPERFLDLEYHKDIGPLIRRSCVGCHSPSNPGGPAASLRLDDQSTINGYDATWTRLARDSGADYGISPIISTGTWRNNNASRYIRKFQSRRSLLTWKVFGRRLDGWSNEDHPTETTPGDASTLPEGASPNQADLDYTGTIMPPPTADPNIYPALSEDEKMTIARWIDLGAPTSSQAGGVLEELGWFADELRPIIDVSLPQAGRQDGPLAQLRLGLFDYYSGLVIQRRTAGPGLD